MFKKRVGVQRQGSCTKLCKSLISDPINFRESSEWKKWLSHVSNFCKNYKSCAVVSPLFVKKPLDNRPYISVKLFDQEIIVLLDSGATGSIVGEKGLPILEHFKLKIYPAKLKNICTADGTPKSVTGLVDLPIVIGDTCQVVTALVVPSLPHNFIFGCDFANQFKISVNFSKNFWQIESKVSNSKVVTPSSFTDFNLDFLCSLDTLSDYDKARAKKTIALFDDIDGKERLGRTEKLTLSIDTGDVKPFHKKPYPMSPYMAEILNKEIDEMLRLGVIEPSQSPWSSPVILVKKSSGEYRLCIDLRGVNEVCRFDSYSLPSIDRILSSLRNAKYISSIDLRKAFWQIPLDEQSKDKTSFSVVGRGSFRFCVVPFGLCNAAQMQQRLVDAIFGPRYEPYVFTYLDDILVCSPDLEHHFNLLAEVRNKLKEANLTVNLEKCEFFKTSLKFLGYIVGSNSLRTDPEKVSAMVNYPRPRSASEVKRFIGLCSWYRRFIKDFSTLVSPINDLLKGRRKSQPITWTDTAESSFVRIKELLVSAPILTQPDFSKPFIIQSDASNTGLGGCLTQEIDGEERVIAYASRSLSRAERNYSVVERECLGVIFCIEKFRMYIEGAPKFKVITDCYSLLWLNNLKNPTGKLARWAIRLRQHNFDLVHRKGVDNIVPDALSRMHTESALSETKDVSCISALNPFDVDIDRIDPWYDQMRQKIKSSPDSYPQWKINDDFLYKFIPDYLPAKSNLPEWKLVVPSPQVLEVIQKCHSPPTSGHFGFFKTFHRVQEYYYWPKMRRDILKFVKSCLVCGAQKSSNSTPMGLMGKEKPIDYPFQCIAIDFVGPFPRSKGGHKWLFVIEDWFTKYTLLFPLRSSKTPHIIKILENEVLLVYGCPQMVICDNGPQFISKSFKDFCKSYEIKIWSNSFYSPQCNFVERNNKTVGTAIRSYVAEHKEWDKEISKIQLAINTAKHEVTQFAPAFLVFGRHLPLSGKYYSDFEILQKKHFELIPGNRESFSDNFQKFHDIFIDIKNRIHSAYERNSRYYNLRKRDFAFNVGDHVWRKNHVLSNAGNQYSAKLAPKFLLSIVHKKLSNLVYILRNTDGTNAGKYHIKDLKVYTGEDVDVQEPDGSSSE